MIQAIELIVEVSLVWFGMSSIRSLLGAWLVRRAEKHVDSGTSASQGIQTYSDPSNLVELIDITIKHPDAITR